MLLPHFNNIIHTAPTHKTRRIEEDRAMIAMRLPSSLSFCFLMSTPRGCIVLGLLLVESCPSIVTFADDAGGEGGRPAEKRKFRTANQPNLNECDHFDHLIVLVMDKPCPHNHP